MNKITVFTGTDTDRLSEEADKFHESQVMPGKAPFYCLWPELRNNIPVHQLQQRRATDDLIDRLKTESVITATHSDVVLGTIRLAVHRGRIIPEQVEIIWLNQDSEPELIIMHPNGGLGNWPMGFFDELDHILDGLLSPP